jgi:hypothetical protein
MASIFDINSKLGIPLDSILFLEKIRTYAGIKSTDRIGLGR